MAEDDLLKRLLDAGMTFTAMTQARAEELMRDLVRAGEVQAGQAQAALEDVLDRSRRNTDKLLDTVRSEIRQQMSNLGLATKDDLARVERAVADLQSAGRERAAASTKASAKRAAAKKAPRGAGKKKATAKKATAKKATAKKATKRSGTKASSTRAAGRGRSA